MDDDDSQLHIQLLSPLGDNDDSTTTTNNVNNDVDLQFKVIVLGNRKVGKRTLLAYLISYHRCMGVTTCRRMLVVVVVITHQ